MPYAAKSAAGIIRKSKSIHRKFTQPQKSTCGFISQAANCLYHRMVEKSSQKVRCRLYALRVKPEPIFRGWLWHKRIRIRAGLCVRLLWTVRGKYHRSTNDKSSFLVRLSPPPPHSRTTTFSSYPHQEHRIFTNFHSQKHMARTKVKLKYHLLSLSQLLTDFLVIASKLLASPPEVGNFAQAEISL